MKRTERSKIPSHMNLKIGRFYALLVSQTCFVCSTRLWMAKWFFLLSPFTDRLRTIISYDRICVLDAGQIAEFDTPANLYEHNGIFRGMCERSSISMDDIKMASKERRIEQEL